jgi:hypothetical protein
MAESKKRNKKGGSSAPSNSSVSGKGRSGKVNYKKDVLLKVIDSILPVSRSE